MIHVALVDKHLFDSIVRSVDTESRPAEIDGKYDFVDGDDIVFMSDNKFSKKYKVMDSKYDGKKTHLEFS